MATVTERLNALNDADLSRLRDRLEALRAEAEKALKLKTTTADALTKAAKDIGISPDEFLALLEFAKKVT